MHSDRQISEDEFDVVYEVMKGESSRGCVLVAAALLEWQMEQLLRQVFLTQHDDPTDEITKQINVMLDPTNEKSILGAAAARGRMCRVLNLISEPIHKLLKEFLVFRNANFAHARSEVTFDDAKIKRGIDRMVKMVPPDMDKFFQTREDTRREFVKIVVVLYFCLEYRI